MKDLLFLGGMFPKTSPYINENSRGNIQNAANVLQWGIIEGIKERKDLRLHLVSAVFIGAFPKLFRRLFVKGAEREEGLIYLPFLNVPILKNVSRYYRVKRYLSHFLKEYKGEGLYICAYSAHTPFIKAVAEMKKKYDIHFHLIVPDLPMYMNLSNKVSLAYKIFKSLDIRVMNRHLSAVDSFTFLTEGMNQEFNHYKKPYTIVEGMINLKTVKSLPSYEKKGKSIVYTGTLEEKYGILNLVRAIKYVKTDLRLIICGKGDAEEEIKKAAREDKRILYKGIVSYEEALRFQGEADVLVNPRPNNETYTKYSFPSKNLEYMMWGKPVLVYKLDGIPDEYDEVFFYFNETKPEAMAKTIDELFEKSERELNKLGKDTRDFALKRKNHIIQTEKILSCLLGEE